MIETHPYDGHLRDLGITRDPKWHKLRAEVIKERGGKCELSGCLSSLEVHHVIPFHFGILLKRPWIELDKRNLFILSTAPTDYHLLLGHLDFFQSYNADVRECGRFAGTAFEEAAAWQEIVAHRAKPWHQMTDADKDALAALIDRLYPR
jgi:hypothetical protein